MRSSGTPGWPVEPSSCLRLPQARLTRPVGPLVGLNTEHLSPPQPTAHAARYIKYIGSVSVSRQVSRNHAALEEIGALGGCDDGGVMASQASMRGEEDTRKKTLRVHPVADTNRRKRHVGFLVLDPQPNSSAWSFWVFNQWVYFHLFSHQRTGGTSNRTDDQEHTHIYIYIEKRNLQNTFSFFWQDSASAFLTMVFSSFTRTAALIFG